MWLALVLICFAIHLASTTFAQLEVVRAFILHRVVKELPHGQTNPDFMLLNNKERALLHLITIVNVTLAFGVVWLALAHLKVERHSDLPVLPFVIAFAIAGLFVINIYVPIYEINRTIRISLSEPSPVLRLIFLALELLAFNVLVAELVLQFLH